MAPVLTIKEKIFLREVSNKEILSKLSDILEKNPNLRFGQALVILGICEDSPKVWPEESVDTYLRMKHKELNM